MYKSEELDILDSDVPEEESSKRELIDLRKRAVAFILDYGTLIGLVYFTQRLILLFTTQIPIEITYTLISVYSLVFVYFEYENNGSIFKKLLKIETQNMDGEKLGIHIYFIKLFLRPIAFFVALFYLKFCTVILLWIFGIYKPLFKFFRGEIFVLWYDYSIQQMTLKTSDIKELNSI